LQNVITYFFNDNHYKLQSLWFKRLLYLFVCGKCIYWLCYYNLLFGQNSVVYIESHSIGFIKDLAFYMYNSTANNIGYSFIVGAFLLCALPFIFYSYSKFSQRTYFIFDFILWLFVINISTKIYPTLTGGDYLLNQFLLFNCFLVFYPEQGSKAYVGQVQTNFKGIKNVFHNFASIAIIIQICLVYFLSALAKLNSEDWLNGTAISTTLQVHHYSLPAFFNIKQNTINYIVNYVVLFYQLFFPVVIWFKKIKKPFLIIGVIMHVFISFVMGLISFGFIMILSYVYFYDFKRNKF
jgi:hypothetical protein